MLVAAKELAPATLTRKRGTEAFKALRRNLTNQNVELELDTSEMLSASFLDELAVQLAESDLLAKVAFLTNQPSTLRKLGIIAQERNLTIFVKKDASDTKSRPVQKLPRRIMIPQPTRAKAG